MKKGKSIANIQPKLEQLVRGWAKEMHHGQKELAFEVPLKNADDTLLIVSETVVSHSEMWIFLRSGEPGSLSFVTSTSVMASLSSAWQEFAMISLVDMRDGAGLTIDVSDEGSAAPVLQVAGWGACTVVVAELFKVIPGAELLRTKGDGGS